MSTRDEPIVGASAFLAWTGPGCSLRAASWPVAEAGSTAVVPQRGLGHASHLTLLLLAGTLYVAATAALGLAPQGPAALAGVLVAALLAAIGGFAFSPI